MLVATAGHIDHGKTALVRALTGVETDRLPEEKARGITIDLGFAYWRPDDDRTIGFINVPGHERFVHNMLAGVGGIDFALLVIAADDGVMPQTIEHAQILDLLAVSRGLVAITKCDRVTRERINEVRGQISALLANTTLAKAPLFEVSTITGAGVTEVGEALRAASKAPSNTQRGGRAFRLAIDRVFSVTGAGTVVTGTVLDGQVEAGARLRLVPSGIEVRVRGLQTGSVTTRRAVAGERCALNLAGVELSQVHRGHWLVAPHLYAPTSRLEARLRALGANGAPLKHLTPVHVHIGAADVEARILIPRHGSIPPGGDAIVHIVLATPVCAATGDRFVVRDQSGRVSIGGGKVADPHVSAARSSFAARAPITAALEASNPADALTALLAIPGHEVSAIHFERCFNLEPAEAKSIYSRVGAVLFGSARVVALPASRVAAISEEVVATLGAFHRSTPEAEGMGARELKAKLTEAISAGAFASLLQYLHDNERVVSVGSLVKMPGHKASLSPADQALWRTLLPWLEDREATPFTTAELAREARTTEASVTALLHRKRAEGEIWRVTDERFLLREQVAALAARAQHLGEQVGDVGFTAAQYRDAIGTGRTWAIHILEFFDTIGVTRRTGDLRKTRPDYALIVGSAPPYTPTRKS